ncbi:GH92 family glycosyl hydrolase [Flavobacterium sp. TSSA_36]|uniref:GH92 family glycosyl hydrolase n=1 Tax=Flavobacterium sp. TSSA_36 TaxID=3447669 RepID=UPI003F3AB4E0
MKTLFHNLILSFLLYSGILIAPALSVQSQDYAKYVNPFIGTGGHGHTFPGATVPYGMVQLSPDTRTQGWDASSGYHYSDSSIIGFSHTHLSGTGIGDLGDILWMPFSGNVQVTPGTSEDTTVGYRSEFSHSDEKASPGYYAVFLKKYGIKAELTATSRAGFHKYTYTKNGPSGIIIDLAHTIFTDKNPEHEIRILNDHEIQGFKKSGGWAEAQQVFFHAKFNKPFKATFYENGKVVPPATKAHSKNLQLVLYFDLQKGEEVLAKVGISSVDNEGAKRNLQSEIPSWNFESIRQKAYALWEKELSKIKVKGGTDNEKTIFYTALYHTSICPNLANDVDFRYLGMDKQIKKTKRKPVYTVFSLWDTFRGNNPLKTITDPEIAANFIHSLLLKYEEGGVLPMWELESNYTGCMIGYHAVSLITDAYQKGIKNFDLSKAYKAMVGSANYSRTGILFPSEDVERRLMPKAKLYNEMYGFIPSNLENQSVSKALEYAYNDWCIAQIAKELGKKLDYQKFMERSKRFTQYYDKTTGFMRGKNTEGTWRTPFDPQFSMHNANDYTEGNAFQWTWFAPHDVANLIALMGGKNSFITNLDRLFSSSSELTGGKVSEDISGLIGQYAHGNEPSHHITHLYNFVGEPWKTQNLTDSILKNLYFNDPNGIAGNEDCGQMSAWYVLNAMGFYSFCPGNPEYSISRPIFDEVSIALTPGRYFTIKTKNNSPQNKYIQSAKLNNEVLPTPFFNHKAIVEGGTLEFEMGDTIRPNAFATD